MTRLSLHLSFATIQDFMLNSVIFYNTSISHEQFDSMPQSIGRSWSSLVEGDEGYIAQVASCTVYDNPPPHHMYGNIHSWGKSCCSSPSTKELHGYSVHEERLKQFAGELKARLNVTLKRHAHWNKSSLN